MRLSIGPFGELCGLAVNEVPELIGGTTPQSATTRPFTYKLFISKKGETTKITLPDHYWNYSFLQPIQRNLFLLTACRAHLYGDGTLDRNARIFDRNGNLVRNFLLGDDIETLQVTDKDTISTGYGDEIIFW